MARQCSSNGDVAVAASTSGVSHYARCGAVISDTPARFDDTCIAPRWKQRRRSRCSHRVALVPDSTLTPGQPLGARVILFSQIRDCASVIESFVRHYDALGIFKLLLYLDNPDDIAHDVLQEGGWIEDGFVEVVVVDDTLRQAWKSMPSWGRVGRFAGVEVQSRQILNAEHALRRARQLDADWLLHVDSDELLLLPECAQNFFANLASRGCTMYTFNNVEGVPQEPDSNDVLQSVRVFRQNVGWIPRNPDTGAAFFNWQLRLGGFFISYENGKSAVNVKHAVKCWSVCMWEVDHQLRPGSSSLPDGSTCTWFTNNDLLWNTAVRRRREGRLQPGEEVPCHDPCRQAVLLHFCVCDFASFWKKKWTQLGYLSASEQFRVRPSSGAMMARFYRLQSEGRQLEARQLYTAMCVCDNDQRISSELACGVLMRASPEHPAGRDAPTWPPPRSNIRYVDLARRCESAGRPYDAWQLYGKALQSLERDGHADAKQCEALAQCYFKRAICANAAGLAGCAVDDALRATAMGCTAGHVTHVEALEALGERARAVTALEAAIDGMAKTVLPNNSTTCVLDDLRKLEARLRCDAASLNKNVWRGLANTIPLPTPAELQRYVAAAVSPEEKDSRLQKALMPVAMSWWQEVKGVESDLVTALRRVAATTRGELTAVDSSVRPRPMQLVRVLWDEREHELKQRGAVALDFAQRGDAVRDWIPAAVRACQEVLRDCDQSVSQGCNADVHPLHSVWLFFSAVVAEVSRAFGLGDLLAATELHVSRSSKQRADGEKDLSGPEVDNGGLLPDNRREVSMRLFLPIDGEQEAPGDSATLALRARDGESVESFTLCPCRVLIWWSRQTYHRVVMGGDRFITIAGFGIVPQAVDIVS